MHSLREYIAAPLVVLTVAVICIPATPLIGFRAVSLVLLLLVSILPLRFGRGPVLISAVIAALSWDFLYIPPLYTFTIGHFEDVMMLGVFVVVAIVSGILTGRIREKELSVIAKEQRTAALFALTKDLSLAHSQYEVISTAVANIKRFFDADVVVYLGEPDGDMPPRPHPASTWQPDQEEAKAAAWSYWNEKTAGRTTPHLPSSQATYLPMSGPRYPLGVVGVRLNSITHTAFGRDSLLENFIAQIGIASERELLNDVHKNTLLLEESERLTKTLFNSLSHELRTPIAAILGSSEQLLRASAETNDAVVQAHVGEVHREAERLNRLISNLLDMSRLEAGRVRPRTDWCDVGDIFRAVEKELHDDLAGRSLTLDVQPDLPLARLDFGLTQQALINLVHNACVHTPLGTPIIATAALKDETFILIIADRGPGIPAKDLPRVFEKFYRSEGAMPGGTGLGLTIAKGFIEAQRGSLSVLNRTEGGAEFVIAFPLEQQGVSH